MSTLKWLIDRLWRQVLESIVELAHIVKRNQRGDSLGDKLGR